MDPLLWHRKAPSPSLVLLPLQHPLPFHTLNVEFSTIIWHQCKCIMCQKDKQEQGIQRWLCENSQDVCEAQSKSPWTAAVLPGRAPVSVQAPPHGRCLYGGSETNDWERKSTSESYILHVRTFLNTLIHISCILSAYVQSWAWWRLCFNKTKLCQKKILRHDWNLICSFFFSPFTINRITVLR